MKPMTFAQPDLFQHRYDALCRRDGAQDGRYVYAVHSTGVYCRPSCAARRPRRENVAFFETREEAERAGFRACKRCRPDRDDDPAADAIARACRLIEASEEAPSLAAMAAAAGLSPHHFHRSFRKATGVAPAAYARGVLARRVEGALETAPSVTAAIHEAGYGAASRFYETAGQRLGMAPRAARRGGRGETIRFAIGQCSLGAVLVAATELGVCAITLGDDPQALARDLQDRFPAAELIGGDAGFEETVARVVALVEAPASAPALPLDIRGTAFQQRVWEALRRIPAGRTATYAEIAAAIGRPAAVRAVAGACAGNALAVAIPCHRVVRTDGSLSGYRWGVERKRALLRREGGAG